MKLLVFQNKSDHKVIQKDIGQPIKEYTGVKLKENCSILSPVFTVTGFTDFETANYLYAEDFGRYYFIDDIVTLNYDMIELHCSVDVLYTYQEQISQTKFVWVRSSTLNSGFFPDPEWALQANKANENYIIGQFPTSTGNNYTLTVAGGT